MLLVEATFFLMIYIPRDGHIRECNCFKLLQSLMISDGGLIEGGAAAPQRDRCPWCWNIAKPQLDPGAAGFERNRLPRANSSSKAS